jgi:stearoyl-CoA desaturase (delta-9 desaturase)
MMGPLHGVIINWFAHKIGYTNFKVKDTSVNLMPVDVFMMGEGYHNNHHHRPSSPNFGSKWYEIDPSYPFILLMRWTGVIKFV